MVRHRLSVTFKHSNAVAWKSSTAGSNFVVARDSDISRSHLSTVVKVHDKKFLSVLQVEERQRQKGVINGPHFPPLLST